MQPPRIDVTHYPASDTVGITFGPTPALSRAELDHLILALQQTRANMDRCRAAPRHHPEAR